MLLRELPIVLGLEGTLVAGITWWCRMQRGRGPVEELRSLGQREALWIAIALGAAHLVRCAVRQRARLLASEGITLARESPRGAAYRAHHPGPRALPPRVAFELRWRAIRTASQWGAFVLAVLLWSRPYGGPLAGWSLALQTLYLAFVGGVYLRYRDGEAFWVPWLLGFCAAAVLMTRDARVAWAPLVVAAMTHTYVLIEERYAAPRSQER